MRSADDGPSRCVWPTNSSSVRGRIRAASGWSAAAGALSVPAAPRAGRRGSHCAKYGLVAPVPSRTVAREWGRIGALGFGGPPAHVALLRDLTVDRREWIDPREFEDAFAACNLLPGPASTQMSIYCAQRVAGRAGAIVGGLAFILPGLARLLVIAARRARRRAAGRRRRVRGGRGGGGRGRGRPGRAEADRPAPRPRLRGRRRARRRARRRRTWSRSCCCAGWSSSAGTSCRRAVWPALIWLAVKVGALSYGGGYVIIPLMYGDAVEAHGWMSEQAFANAVAYGQITPGPVTHTVALVGYAAGGLGRRARRHRGRLRAQLRVRHARRPPLRAACGRARTPARSSTAPGPAAAGAILGAAVPLARRDRRPPGSGSSSPPPRSRCSRASRRSPCWSGARWRGSPLRSFEWGSPRSCRTRPPRSCPA